MKQDMIAVIDLGSRENTVVARAVRALGVYSEIHPHDLDAKSVAALPGLCGFILCGGENNVVDGEKIDASEAIYGAGLPIFVIAHDCRLKTDADVFDPGSPAFAAFVEKCANGRKTWNMDNFIADQIDIVRAQVGDGKVLLALSGGVDSSVVAALLLRAIGDRLTCVHVNHGLLRKGEAEQVVEVFGDNLGANLVYVDAVDRFLSKLEGVADPEQKRKIIGAEFIRVFEEEARKLGDVGFLGQGTIYPDIVESGTKTAQSVKSHHNVGGLPDDLKFELVEPLKMLFKDEVRECGRALGLPERMVDRQPFPGPGLGVRCLGAITRDRLEAVSESDAILREEFEKAGRQGQVWQYFTIVPDFKSTGVRDGVRCYDWPVVIRAVNTVDAMTASVEPIDWALLEKISARILVEVKGVNRVLYDCTPKPPATIEWE